MKTILLVLAFSMASVVVRAQDEPPPATTSSRFADLLGLAKSLHLEPKVIEGTGSGDTTLGVAYRYERRLGSLSGGRDFDLHLESRGLLVADPELSPERRLQHRLRLSVIDLLGDSASDYERQRDPANGEVWRWQHARLDAEHQRLRGLYRQWTASEDDGERGTLLAQAQQLWRDRTGGVIHVVDGKWVEIERAIEPVIDEVQQSTSDFLTLTADIGVESDQRFRDVQVVGGVQLRGKFGLLGAPLERLFELTRGYAAPIDYRNHDAGPYLWAGLEAVDASANESREALVTSSDEQFLRVGLGAFYRNELLDLGQRGDPQPVGLELEWRYYFELDAPQAIEQAGFDQTSWFRARLLLPGDLVVEYTDGRQPLDLADSSTLFVGFQFGRSAAGH